MFSLTDMSFLTVITICEIYDKIVLWDMKNPNYKTVAAALCSVLRSFK